MVETPTHTGLDTSLLAQHLYGWLASADSLRTATQVHLLVILYADKALRDLGTFDFVVLHLLSAVRRHESVVAEILHLIEILEELHTKVQGVITSPHPSTKIMFDAFRRWSLYLNK